MVNGLQHYRVAGPGRSGVLHQGGRLCIFGQIKQDDLLEHLSPKNAILYLASVHIIIIPIEVVFG